MGVLVPTLVGVHQFQVIEAKTIAGFDGVWRQTIDALETILFFPHILTKLGSTGRDGGLQR